ncbi:MAG: DUF1947 domain-containing protein [Candidatus Bathyarchaeia archaeon]
MSKKARRHNLREKEVKQLLAEATKQARMDLQTIFGPKPNIEVLEEAETKIFIFNGKPVLAGIGNILFPTLLFNEALEFLPKVVVDMGAVPHVCNGADVMVPGIVRVEGSFSKDNIVLITDVQHGKPIAVGTALLDSKDMKNITHGKAVKNIHHIGDKLWNKLKKI